MPRLLSLWLDYGAELHELEKRARSSELTVTSMKTYLGRLNKHMSDYIKRLAPYQVLILLTLRDTSLFIGPGGY